jgi:hypothetical protein
MSEVLSAVENSTKNRGNVKSFSKHREIIGLSADAGLHSAYEAFPRQRANQFRISEREQRSVS